MITPAAPPTYVVEVPLMQPPASRRKTPRAGQARVVRPPQPCEPLNANWRIHHYERARRVKHIREAVAWGARRAKVPKCAYMEVTLHYAPGDNRPRDEDNLYPVLKAAADALSTNKRSKFVGLGLVPNDTPRYMRKNSPVIHPGPGKRRMWLEITTSDWPRP